jgi:hypothetical protein
MRASTRTLTGRGRRAVTAAGVLLVLPLAGCGSSAPAPVAASAAPSGGPAITSSPTPGGTARADPSDNLAGPLAPPTPQPTRSRSAPAGAPVPTGPRAKCGAAAGTPGGADPWGGCWPGPGTTGVPAGTALSAYTGPCDLRTAGVVIDAKIVDCGGMLVYAANVVIRRSKVVGIVKTNSGGASLRIEDSEIDGQDDQSEAIGMNNVTVLRTDVRGDQHSVHCGDSCTVIDSWLHDQHDGKAAGWHQNAFITNGGGNHLLRHNTLQCVGGCTADIGLIPDADIAHVTVERNLLLASPDSAYCAYGGGNSGNKPGRASFIVYTGNVFQRGAKGTCATYGPVTYFDTGAPGNTWTGNVWDAGGAVPPAN